MSKVKEYYADKAGYYCSEGDCPPIDSSFPVYIENTDLEQSIGVGDTVRVYDGNTLFKPREGVVLFRRNVEGRIILDIDLGSGALAQVYEIQCMRLSKRLPRILWLKFNKSTQEYEVSVKKPDDSVNWYKFKEEI